MAAALCAGGWQTRAAERPLSDHPAPGRRLERVKEKLNLTDDQVARIKEELDAERGTLKELILRLHDARVGVRAAIRAAGATEASLRTAAARVGAVQAELAVERFRLYGRIDPILTDEQREKVKEFEARIDEWVETAVMRLGEKGAE